PVDTVKVDRLRATRGAAGESQPFLTDEGVDQAGLSYITSTKKRDLPQAVPGKHGRLVGAHYKFRFQNINRSRLRLMRDRFVGWWLHFHTWGHRQSHEFPLQRDLQHLVHRIDEVQLHGLLDGVGNVRKVL